MATGWLRDSKLAERCSLLEGDQDDAKGLLLHQGLGIVAVLLPARFPAQLLEFLGEVEVEQRAGDQARGALRAAVASAG